MYILSLSDYVEYLNLHLNTKIDDIFLAGIEYISDSLLRDPNTKAFFSRRTVSSNNSRDFFLNGNMLSITHKESPTRSTKSNLDECSPVGTIRREPLLPADLVAYQNISISSNQEILTRHYITVRQLCEQYNLDGQNQTHRRSEATLKDLLLLRQSIKDDTQISPIDKADLICQITKHALNIFNTQRKQSSWKHPGI